MRRCPNHRLHEVTWKDEGRHGWRTKLFSTLARTFSESRAHEMGAREYLPVTSDAYLQLLYNQESLH